MLKFISTHPAFFSPFFKKATKITSQEGFVPMSSGLWWSTEKFHEIEILGIRDEGGRGRVVLGGAGCT